MDDHVAKVRVERTLMHLGAPTGRLGYSQMAYALEILMESDQVVSTTNVLYPMVAERYHTTRTRVERNIREEIRAVWLYGNQSLLDSYFVNRGKYPPGNKEFLYTLARRLQFIGEE